jgi:hypothetical protein
MLKRIGHIGYLILWLLFGLVNYFIDPISVQTFEILYCVGTTGIS